MKIDPILWKYVCVPVVRLYVQQNFTEFLLKCEDYLQL